MINYMYNYIYIYIYIYIYHILYKLDIVNNKAKVLYMNLFIIYISYNVYNIDFKKTLISFNCVNNLQ